MKHIKTGSNRRHFKILAATRSVQAAMMVLRPGQDTGIPGNEHPRSEQWLFVVSGSGQAVVNGRRITLRRHSLLLINKAESHRIKNTGRKQLITLNLYAPPAYDNRGEPRS